MLKVIDFSRRPLHQLLNRREWPMRVIRITTECTNLICIHADMTERRMLARHRSLSWLRHRNITDACRRARQSKMNTFTHRHTSPWAIWKGGSKKWWEIVSVRDSDTHRCDTEWSNDFYPSSFLGCFEEWEGCNRLIVAIIKNEGRASVFDLNNDSTRDRKRVSTNKRLEWTSEKCVVDGSIASSQQWMFGSRRVMLLAP